VVTNPLFKPLGTADLVSTAELDFLRGLPPGWRLKVEFERTADPGRYLQTSFHYVGPDGSAPYVSRDQVLAHTLLAQAPKAHPAGGADARTETSA
jgi:hypothetical protein